MAEESIPLVKCANIECDNLVKPPLRVCRACKIIKENNAKTESEARIKVAQELRVKQAAKKLKDKAAQREEQAEAEALEEYDSPDPVKKADAKDILRDHRNLTQGYIVNAAYECGMIAAKRLSLTPNAYYWKHGVLSALASHEQEKPVDVLPPHTDQKAYGEVFREQDQIALWDYAVSWRPQPAKEGFWEEGHQLTLKEYQELRHLKGDPIKMGVVLLDREFEAQPHGEWQKFHPVPNINHLPENYSQRQLNDALATIHEFNTYMLLAARDTFKSTWIVTTMLAFQCVYYDLSILVASAAQPLALDFVKSIRKKFLVDFDLTLWQQVFPELVLWEDEGGVSSYQNPAARLQLPQPSIYVASLDSQVAGKRCHWLIADDLADNTNSDNPTLLEGTQRKWELLTQLVSAQGWTTVTGTPYAPGDIYEVTKERADLDTEKNVTYRVDPIFTINDVVRRKEIFDKPELVKTLTEDECTLLFPIRYTWRKIRNKMTNSVLITFMQQQMLRWSNRDDDIKLNFEKEHLEKALVDKAPDSCDITQIILSIDRGLSIKPRADRSSISILKFHRNEKGYPSLAVLHNRADRWRTSELAEQIVECFQEFRPDVVITEEDADFQSLLDAVQIECDKKDVILNIFVSPISNTKKSKQIKFKGLEGLLNTGRLTFVRGPWIEDLFGEFLWLDGDKKSNGYLQKDDRPDSIAIGAALLPSPQSSDQTKATQEAYDKFEENVKRREQYNMIYGEAPWAQPVYNHPGQAAPPEPMDDGLSTSPIHRALQQGNKVKQPQKPQLSFSSSPRVHNR